MIKKYTIYQIINPKGQIYIGCTSNVEKRKTQYNCKTTIHGLISESMNLYGFKAHEFYEIDSIVGTKDEAYSLEMFWIRTKMSNVYKFPNMNGLNLTDGGSGNLGTKFKSERCHKISQSLTGKKLSETHKQSLKNSNARYWLGKNRSEETKNKLSVKHTGKKLSPEHRKKLSESHKGQVSTQRKEISQFDLNGNHICDYESVTKATEILKCSRTGISNVLIGYSKTHKGFIFKYKEVNNGC